MSMENQFKILVIDDEENIRKMLKKSLENSGYRVELALTGEEGVEKVLKNDYDLIMLDLKLPGIEGEKVLKKIRNKDILTPVLIITGYGSIESAVSVMKLGAVDYLQKPFNPEEIKEQVDDIITRKSLENFQGDQPENYQTLISRAKAAINKRNFEFAAELLQKTAQQDNNSPEPFNLLGVLAEMKGDNTQAMKMYRTALDIEPSYKPAQENLNRASQLISYPEDASLGENKTENKTKENKEEDNK